MLLHLVLRNSEGQAEYLRQHITKILNESDSGVITEEIKYRIRYIQDDKQKEVLIELVNDFTSKR